ncbi:MAG: hypothetical protein ABR76_03075 [Acidimicrobiia bacterium BACL6 MAG-121220-bin61]|nr:MAG: hypothetical protein ABR76_03075 [Acidimicrobiia bacterium BACL6 MAG-121220-bin61]
MVVGGSARMMLMDNAFELDLDVHATRVTASTTSAQVCNSPRGIFSECPHCGSGLYAEHAHFRCASCGWRDSCCD